MEPFGAALLKSSAAAVAIAAGALCLRSLLSPSPAAADLSARAAKARASRDAARDAYKRSRLVAPWPAPSDHSPAAENMRHICSLNATALLEEMTAGRLTSVQVMRAFCSRALHVGERLDTNAQECFADALAAAEEADSARAAGRPLGALHGLPVSVKDQLDMAGCDSTCGLQVRCGAPAEHDSLLVKLLRDQGAIPFVRSNVPQCLMLPESANRIWGAARNPWDASRTPGGSSGGEAALVAARASPLGIGTDIGGSIRIPAHFCGVFGFKPTPDRISNRGVAVPRPGNRPSGQIAVKSTAGPFGRSVADLRLVMRAWLAGGGMSDSDVTSPRAGWAEAEPGKPRGRLRFGLLATDSFFDPSPACGRAVSEAAAALEAAGHEVVALPGEFYEAALLYVSLLAAEGGLQGFIDGLEGEELLPMYSFLLRIASLPALLRPALRWALRHLLGQPRMASRSPGGRARRGGPRGAMCLR